MTSAYARRTHSAKPQGFGGDASFTRSFELAFRLARRRVSASAATCGAHPAGIAPGQTPFGEEPCAGSSGVRGESWLAGLSTPLGVAWQMRKRKRVAAPVRARSRELRFVPVRRIRCRS